MSTMPSTQCIICDGTLQGIEFPRIAGYRFVAEAIEPIQLPLYTGSAWRGLLAGTAKRLFCGTGTLACDGCALWSNCAYHAVFELPPRDRNGRPPVLSHPYLLQVPSPKARTLSPGEPLEIGITLIGAAHALLPNLAYTLLQAGQVGLAKGRGRFQLRRVLRERVLGGGEWIDILADGRPVPVSEDSQPLRCPAPIDPILIQLETPLRLQRKMTAAGRSELVGVEQFDGAVFLHNLVRRLETLARDFGTGFDPAPWRSLRAAIPQQHPLLDADLQWWDWSRYSSRQERTMKLGGITGRFSLDLSSAPALWPCLWLGQWVHVGKATSFGLGRYCIAGLDASQSTS